MSLLPFEIGGTLFDVSGKTFLGVFAGEEELLEFAFEAEGFGERDFRAGDDGALNAADGAGGFVPGSEFAQSVGHREARGSQGWKQATEQPHRQCPF